VPPGLFDFLWAQAFGDGVDMTRVTDIGAQDSSSRYSNVAAQQGEPFGEIGLVTPRDHGLWQDQTGGPTDPQPGNIPGGARDVLRTADFNDGTISSFAPDSGKWEVNGGALKVSAASTSQDAVAVLYVDDYLPVYFEMQAKISMEKPTAGWKANAYLIFDYFSPTDFKFAGLDESVNKLVVGHRDASGWHVDRQGAVPGGVNSGKVYDMLLAVNGTHVTLLIDNKSVFTHIFAPRIIDGEAAGLNRGMIGVGSDRARGVFDNVKAQILPPEITLDLQAGARTLGAPGVSGLDQSVIDLGADLQPGSYLDIEARLRTDAMGGVVFDRYADDDFKFVAIDVQGDRLVFGHMDPKRGLQIDQSVVRSLDAGVEYALKLVFKGASVSATVNGAMVGSWGYNSAVVDGKVGVLGKDGSASFSSVRVRTNDPAFEAPEGMTATYALAGESTATLTQPELNAIAEVAITLWTEALGSADARLALLQDVQVGIDDLAGAQLGRAEGATLLLDINGAGHGWFVDLSPEDSSEFRARLAEGVVAATPGSAAYGRMDLLTVVTHELGHVMGFDHMTAGGLPVMVEELQAGMRYLVAPREAAAARAAVPVVPQRDLTADIGAAASAVRVEWQAPLGESWGSPLSLYEPVKAKKPATTNFADFAPVKPQGIFDSLGRALLGKGKTK
jgi:hypothetical protein